MLKDSVIDFTLKKQIFKKDLSSYDYDNHSGTSAYEIICVIEQTYILRIEHVEDNRVIAVLLNTIRDADPAKIQWRGQIFQFMLFENSWFKKLYYSRGRYYLEETSHVIKINNRQDAL